MARVFYWFGAYYSTTLFAQASLMIFVQLLLLKIALDNRPSAGLKNGIEHIPFTSASAGDNRGISRPYGFWQWKNSRMYVSYIFYGY